MKNIIILLLLFVTTPTIAQNNYGKQLLMNGNAYTYFVYNGTDKPVMRKKNMTNFPKPWTEYVVFEPTVSNICDSSTGEVLMNVSPQYIYDSMGNIIEGGDDVLNPIAYNFLQTHTSLIHGPLGTIILPRGGKVFDVFVPFFTDSAFYNYSVNYNDTFNSQMNVLLHHVVDMNANNGHGKVVVKKHNILGAGISLMKNGMQAVRHANGKDWWLCKMGYGRLLSDSIFMYTFLVKADTIIGPQAHYLGMFTDYLGKPSNYINKNGYQGQLSFSKDGSQFVYVSLANFQLLLGDFNRCSGAIDGIKLVGTPKKQGLYVYGDTVLTNDSTDYETNLGVLFSPNGRFVYLTRDFQVFQWDSYAPDSISAWYAVKLGLDTNNGAQSFYAMMHLGPDDRIIIGTDWGTSMFLGGITEPNKKGAACNFVGKYLRLSDPIYNYRAMRSVGNQPNYLLGEDNNICWPLGVPNVGKSSINGFTVYPNPSSGNIQIVLDNAIVAPVQVTICNTIGVQVYQETMPANTNKYTLHTKLATGIYLVKIGGITKRIVVE